VLVIFDPARAGAGEVAAGLRSRRVDPAPDRGGGGPLVEVPVRYGGQDLPEVARITGLRESEVVERHLRPEYVVAFCGFAPGFGYLIGGDPALQVPRRSSPRTDVPAGSVGLAGEFCGVYPRRMPGGWQLIGSTDAVLWDLTRDPPSLLPPGTRVRFVRPDPVAAG
jgi:KipI family sensor histidine kinase inhibitor